MRGRLLLLIAALVLPALAIVVVLSWEAYRSQQRAVRAELANTARAVAGMVDREVDRLLTILHAVTAARSLREKDWSTLDETARRVLPDGKRWLVLVDGNGRQMVNTLLPRGTPIPDIDLAPSYVAAMNAGRDFVSGLVLGPAAKTLVVHIARPVVYADGSRYGLNVVMEPDALGETLDVRRFAPDGVITILDPEGRIIARNPYQKGFIGGSATADIVKATRENEEGTRESVTLEGIEVFTAFCRAKCGWTVAIGTPKARFVAATQRLLYMGLGAAGLVTLTAIGLARWIARAVVRSVDSLAQDAERLARGEPPAAPRSGLVEINLVADAMRNMAATKTEAQAQLQEARDRLHSYAQELERKVEERTASLREAVTQMEEFSYTVSHDLRGPLRAMTAYAQTLLEDCGPSLGEEARGYLRRIMRASQRMDRLTSDLLNYSRVAREDLSRTRVALEPIVRGALDHYGELNPSVADIVVVTPMHDVLAHESSLTQAIANLLTNAAKFVKPGERPRITVRTERQDERVRVWVEDNGIGIPKPHQERLFRIFERTPGAGKYDGTGVGLAIVRKIVEKSKGTCGVESDGVSGSRFWIELEAASAELRSAAAPAGNPANAESESVALP